MNVENTILILYHLIFLVQYLDELQFSFPILDTKGNASFIKLEVLLGCPLKRALKSHILPLSAFSCSVLRHFYQAYQENWILLMSGKVLVKVDSLQFN